MQTCRKTPEPYVVHHLSHKFFKTGFENSYHNTIRPGSNKQGQPTVNELSALKYQKSGIEYKLDLEDEWKLLPQRMARHPDIKLQHTYANRLPIPERKYKDLQALKAVIPNDNLTHSFYDGLPKI